ncbi:hypothetical protein BC828DRAFT_343835 [Blastocladiella britannica]|nr:hypothetical protein BC828DRAFT_343835 [Blastocladiella britannica]
MNCLARVTVVATAAARATKTPTLSRLAWRSVRALSTKAAADTAPVLDLASRSNNSSEKESTRPPKPKWTGKRTEPVVPKVPLTHQEIGEQQQLFMFHDLSPGSAFFLPAGAAMVHRLMNLIRQQYRRYGYSEVITPQLYKRPLWVQSGHWQNYKDDMFTVLPGVGDALSSVGAAGSPSPTSTAESDAPGHNHEHHEHHEGGCAHDAHHALDAANDTSGLYGLKPMNCPGHCLLYNATRRSHAELPMRVADFSPLHRNEASGALSGLTRVRRFHQDDAHIFCTPEQVGSEIESSLAMIDDVYRLFGFPSWEYTLSTRPEKYLGEVQQWDEAEDVLRKALNGREVAWKENPGDGAFYGPKIDVRVRDAAGRMHQTATIQLDFQLPRQFKLEYTDEHNQVKTPVMIHRAVLGSVERMLAILAEHYQGKWPLWLSPRPAIVIPVHRQREYLVEYADRVASLLRGSTRLPQKYGHVTGRWVQANLTWIQRAAWRGSTLRTVDVDQSSDSLQNKLRKAHAKGYAYAILVGDRDWQLDAVSMTPLQTSSDAQNRELKFAHWETLPAQARGSRLLKLHEMVAFFDVASDGFVEDRLFDASDQVNEVDDGDFQE